jgi:hypothetical protein
MSLHTKLVALLVLVMALGVWCCTLGFGAVATGTDPEAWWAILLLLVVAPAGLVFMRMWRRPPKI